MKKIFRKRCKSYNLFEAEKKLNVSIVFENRFHIIKLIIIICYLIKRKHQHILMV